MIAQQEKYIKKEADELVRIKFKALVSTYGDREKDLKTEYIAKKSAYIFLCIIAILMSGCQAIGSEAFRMDFKAFFVSVWTFICFVGQKALEAAHIASEMQTNTFYLWIFHYLVFGIVFIIVFGGVIALIVVPIWKLFKWFYNHFWDMTSLYVVAISSIVVVNFSEFFKNLTQVNLIFLIFSILVFYAASRSCFAVKETSY